MPPHLVQSGWMMSTACCSQKRPKALPARQHFAGRDRQRRMAAQLDEAVEIVRRQGFLEPDDVVVGEHLGRLQAPTCSRAARTARCRRHRP